MANQILQKQLTAVTWKTSGGTQTITLTSLGAAAGRKGVTNDFGATFAARCVVELLTKFGSAPAAGATVEVYWCSSRDNSAFDAGQSSADAAFTDTDLNKQLHWIGSLIADNTTSAQQQSWMFYLPGRYGFPVIYNATGQALSGTAADHVLTVTPLADEVQ
ncbi:MAG: hypothetical protein ACREO2_09110 [Arenimonas sp.]